MMIKIAAATVTTCKPAKQKQRGHYKMIASARVIGHSRYRVCRNRHLHVNCYEFIIVHKVEGLAPSRFRFGSRAVLHAPEKSNQHKVKIKLQTKI